MSEQRDETAKGMAYFEYELESELDGALKELDAFDTDDGESPEETNDQQDYETYDEQGYETDETEHETNDEEGDPGENRVDRKEKENDDDLDEGAFNDYLSKGNPEYEASEEQENSDQSAAETPEAVWSRAASHMKALATAREQSKAAVATMVDASSSQRRIPFMAGGGHVLFGEGHPWEVTKLLGPTHAIGFVRFDRRRIGGNHFFFENVTVTGVLTQQLKEAAQNALKDYARDVYHYENINRVTFHWFAPAS